MKRCSGCKTFKDLSQFNKNRTTKDGFRIYCKDCDKVYHKAHYNSQKATAYTKKYYEKNHDIALEKAKLYRESHREEINQKAVEYYHKVKHLLPDKSQYKHEWYMKNRERVIKKNNERKLSRCKEDVNYKLACGLRSRLSSAIRELFKGKRKAGSAVRDLGCTIGALRIYLESKFQEGMSWDNRGIHGWHIDHIQPLVSFDLTDREQFLKAVHYTNLQPLWAKDNLKKHDKEVKYV